MLVRRKKRFSKIVGYGRADPMRLALFDMVKRHSSGCDRSAQICPARERSRTERKSPGCAVGFVRKDRPAARPMLHMALS
jgi:hypothetical protein